MKRKLLRFSATFILCFLNFSNVLADQFEFPFGWGPGKNTFHCIIVGDLATEVLIDSHNIDLRGACSGPYVVRPGHLKLPVSVVNSFSFGVHQGSPRSGSVTIDTPPNTPIICDDFGGGRPEFGDDEYC